MKHNITSIDKPESFTIKSEIIKDSTLKFLEENFEFKEDFLSIGTHLLDRQMIVLYYNNKPVSIALIDILNYKEGSLIAEEIIDRFSDKIEILECSDDISLTNKNENILILKQDLEIFKKEDFCYIFYCESNIKNKGFGSILTAYLKDKYKYISALPMNDGSLKMLKKNKFNDINGFYYSIATNEIQEVKNETI